MLLPVLQCTGRPTIESGPSRRVSSAGLRTTTPEPASGPSRGFSSEPSLLGKGQGKRDGGGDTCGGQTVFSRGGNVDRQKGISGVSC